VNRAHIGAIEMSSERRSVFAAPDLIKRVFRAVRGLPDRLLHQRRQLAARDRLSRMARPRRLLVVCYGNICRSPYLEAVLKRTMPDIPVDSAGLMGPGRPVPPFALAVSAQRGLNLSAFRSRPLVPGVVRAADLIVVMDGYQARYVERYFRVPRKQIVVAGDLDPVPSASRAIADPWGQPMDVFVSSFNRLDRCAAMLVSLLSREPIPLSHGRSESSMIP
jgi:protein-tyrosine phosphatase